MTNHSVAVAGKSRSIVSSGWQRQASRGLGKDSSACCIFFLAPPETDLSLAHMRIHVQYAYLQMFSTSYRRTEHKEWLMNQYLK